MLHHDEAGLGKLPDNNLTYLRFAHCSETQISIILRCWLAGLVLLQ